MFRAKKGLLIYFMVKCASIMVLKIITIMMTLKRTIRHQDQLSIICI